jgi:hypothetical protein
MNQQFNIQQLYVLPTHCIYVFCIYLRTNSDFCHLHHKLIGFYNRDCLLRGTSWLFQSIFNGLATLFSHIFSFFISTPSPLTVPRSKPPQNTICFPYCYNPPNINVSLVPLWRCGRIGNMPYMNSSVSRHQTVRGGWVIVIRLHLEVQCCYFSYVDLF